MGRDLVDRVLVVFGSNLGAQLVVIATTPILVRLLGVSAYGEYAFVLSVMSLSAVVASAGTFDSTRKFIAEQRSWENWRNHVFSIYTRTVLLIGFAISILFILISTFDLIRLLMGENKSSYTLYFYFLALLVPLQAVFRLSRSALMGLDLESYSEPLFIVQRILFGISAIVLIWLGWGVVGALIGQVIALIVVVGCALTLLNREIKLSSIIRPIPSSFPCRTLLSYNVSTVALKLLNASLYNIDIILLGLIAGDAATGSYRAALVVAEFLWLVPMAVQIVLLHSTSQLWSNNESESISKLSSKAVRFTLVFTLLLVIGVAALAEQVITLYFGSEFIRAADTLLFLLPGALGFAVARPIFATGQGHGDLRPVLLATGTAALLNVLLNVILIPQYGAVGAAIATSIGYGSMFLFHILSAYYLGFNPVADLRLPRVLTTAIIAAVPIFGLVRLLPGNLLPLFVVPPIGFIIYSLLALRTRAIDPEELRILTKRVPIHSLEDTLPPSVLKIIQSSIDSIMGPR